MGARRNFRIRNIIRNIMIYVSPPLATLLLFLMLDAFFASIVAFFFIPHLIVLVIVFLFLLIVITIIISIFFIRLLILMHRAIPSRSVLYLFSIIYSAFSGVLAGGWVVTSKPLVISALSMAAKIGGIIGSVVLLGISIAFPLSYGIEVWGAVISDIGVFLMAMGFVMLITPGTPYVTPAGVIVGSGGALMATGLREYFRVIFTSPDPRIEVVEDKPVLNTFPDFCGTNRPPQQNAIGYLRLHVRNVGRGAAKNCVAQVRVLRRLSIDGSGECRGGPSGEYNDWLDLTWTGNKDRVDINPNDVRIFNLVVMPLDGNNRPFFAGNPSMATACGGSPPYAWFARPDVTNVVFVMQDNKPIILNGCLNRPQDCLTRCVYEIEVQVTCENGRAEPVRLRLTIGDEWGSTRIERV